MARFYTADTHLGHARTLDVDHCDRPFDTVEQMNAAIVDNINAVAGPSDELWLLGDACLGTLLESLAWIGKIASTVHLINGNHDRTWSGHRKPKKFDEYHAAGFVTIADEAVHTIAGRQVTLSHFPYAGDHTGTDRYHRWRPTDAGGWLVHGHVHNAFAQRGRQINVGVDVRDFAPVSEDELAAIIAQGPADR